MNFAKPELKYLAMTFFAAAGFFGRTEAADIQTVDGRSYHNVSLLQVSQNGLIFKHGGGIVTLAPDVLTRKDRDQYSAQIAKFYSAIAKKEIDAAIRMYAKNRQEEALGMMEKAVRKYAGTPEAEKGKKLLTEWKLEKQKQLIVYHPEISAECRVYLFKYLAELEPLLKNIADAHWKVNDLNDAYIASKNQAEYYMRRNSALAKDALDRARMILQKSRQARDLIDKTFENLLSQGFAVYQTTFLDRGMRLTGVSAEYIVFIVEVVDRGKYVRAWCCRAKGGSSLSINGRTITASLPVTAGTGGSD